MDSRVIAIQNELEKNADKRTKDSVSNFFRESIRCHGVKMSIVQKIGKRYLSALGPLSKTELFTLSTELLQTVYLEEEIMAATWAYSARTQFEKEDIHTFHEWLLRYIDNWAACDTLCNHAVGALVMEFPELVADLKVWAKSDNRWVRRASAVSLIIPAKQGLFLKDICELADILLLDADDMVQKGYGWMLKEASRQHMKEIFSYLMLHKHDMPRTAFRYALEKMPEAYREKAMRR